MPKVRKKKTIAKDQGAPNFLILTIIIVAPYLCLLMIKSTLSSGSFLPAIAMTCFIAQGLTICFYWRRLAKRAYKKFIAYGACLCQWGFMAGIAWSTGEQQNVQYAVLALLTCAAFGGLYSLVWLLEATGTNKWQSVIMTGCASFICWNLFSDVNVERYMPAMPNIPAPKSKLLDAKKFLSESKYILKADDEAFEETNNDRKWGYKGLTGPAFWGKLKPEFKLCKSGKKQSPLNIPRFVKTLDDVVQTNYVDSPLHVASSGRHIFLKVNPSNEALIHDTSYTLRRIRFHTPSEHKLSGKSYAAEIQFIHSNDDGQKSIFSVFVRTGRRNELMSKVLDNLPEDDSDTVSPREVFINPEDLMPADSKVYAYSGSLTTPPCYESVSWNVFREPITMSRAQINLLSKTHPKNNRPTQALNKRKIGSFKK